MIIWSIIIGALAGFLAGRVTKGRGFGFFGNLIVGIAGAILGSFIFKILGINLAWVPFARLITAFLGAVVLLFIIGLFKKRS